MPPLRTHSAAPGSRTASSWCVEGTTGRSGAATPPARCSRRRRGSGVRRAFAFPVLLLVVFAASGWLYLVRTPGRPSVGDALPLDELSRHSSASLAVFAGIWAAGAVFLGLYAKWARI